MLSKKYKQKITILRIVARKVGGARGEFLGYKHSLTEESKDLVKLRTFRYTQEP